MKIKEKLMHKYALSPQGASDMLKAFVSVTVSDLVLMIPVSLLYFIVKDYMEGTLQGKGGFYIAGIIVTLALIAITTYIQYNATFLSTYVESGVRRITLAEKLRKIPLSFFGKKDLSDLTSTIMADCAQMETASSHFIPELVGACISTAIVAVGMFFFNWRMALAALWVLPVSFLIVGCSGKVQKSLNQKQMELKMACADGIQECLESARDLHAYNAEDDYMRGLDVKIKAVEKHAVVTELGTAVFVGSAQMILKLGIATVALVGGTLLAKGEISVLTFFMFLLVVSRIYDPMQVSLQNLAAIISSEVQSARLDEILSHEVQEGSEKMDRKGYDIEFSNVGFSYDSGETVLKDVSFVAKQGEVTALIGPSGGGKTTVSRLASRFWDVDHGKITVGGMDISKVDPETLMSLYSIVFQDVTLFNNTIMENIRIGKMDATDEGQIRDAVQWTKHHVGEIDAVVYVAGILLQSDRTETLLTESLDDIRKQIEVNALGLITVFRDFLPVIKKSGLFIGVTSEGGSFANEGSLFPAYGVSKTTANKIIQTLRVTVGESINVYAVHPGRMNTDMGRTTAQIEPEEAAIGFCNILEGTTHIEKDQWFIDYRGNAMPL